jgi:hypothetical protein
LDSEEDKKTEIQKFKIWWQIKEISGMKFSTLLVVCILLFSQHLVSAITDEGKL